MLILRRVPRRSSSLSAALAATETTTALGIAHTAAGGELPSVGWLLVVAVTAYGASRLVLHHRAPIRVVLPALVGTQVLLHAWLVALTRHDGGGAHGAGTDALIGLTWPMLLAHLAAGAVAALAWLLRRRAVDVLLAWAAAPRLHPPRLSEREHLDPTPRPRNRRAPTAPTRGPPVLACAAA